MKVFFDHKQELAPGIWQHFFKPERPVSFVPGQYVNFQLPTVHGDPRGSSRTFTLTSLPAEPLLSFIAKFELPASLYKQQLHALVRGYEAKIGDAMGDLVLPKSTTVPLVFVAGGIGIASYASMLRWLSVIKEQRSITLFYTLRYKHEAILQDVIADYPFPIRKSKHIAPDRLNANQILRAITPTSLIYISGSQRFVEELQHDLETRSVRREQIVFDFFDGYVEL